MRRLLAKIKRRAIALAVVIVTVAQTTIPDQVYDTVQSITPILMTLISIVILIAVPVLAFKVLAKSVIDKL